MKVRRSLLKDLVSVETYQGQGAFGPSYADPVSVAVHVNMTRRLVRSSDGTEHVSEFTLDVHPDDENKFPPESKVTFGPRTSQVLTLSPQTVRGYTTHVRVACS